MPRTLTSCPIISRLQLTFTNNPSHLARGRSRTNVPYYQSIATWNSKVEPLTNYPTCARFRDLACTNPFCLHSFQFVLSSIMPTHVLNYSSQKMLDFEGGNARWFQTTVKLALSPKFKVNDGFTSGLSGGYWPSFIMWKEPTSAVPC